MVSHRYHPDEAQGDNPDSILFDNCERCSEHARELISLDGDNLRAIVEMCKGVRNITTRNESIAEGRIYKALIISGRLVGRDLMRELP